MKQIKKDFHDHKSELKNLVASGVNKNIFYYNKRTMKEVFFKKSQISDINLKCFLLVVLMNLDLKSLNNSRVHTNMYNQVSEYGDIIKFENGALVQSADYKWSNSKRIIFSPNPCVRIV